MPNPSPAFSFEEYNSRLNKVRAAMDGRGIELLVISDPSNMAWLTGYDGWSFYVHQAVIVGPSGPPIWWGRGMDAVGAGRTTWLPNDQIYEYDDLYVQNPDRHPMENLVQLIDAQGWGGLKLGVEMDNYYFSAKAFQTLSANGHFSAIQDATGLVNWQRLVKSDQEIEYIRRAAHITDAMHAKIREIARPGLPKNELIAEIYAQGIQGAKGHWGDYPAIVPMAPSGLDATAAHLTWDDSPLRAGETTFFEISGCYRRYHCPQSRTIFIGNLPDKYNYAQDAVADATDKVLASAKPGATCEEIAHAFNATLKSHGFEKKSRCGYSIGLSYPPDWGERTVSLREGDKTKLKAGIVLHFMPALWLDDGGLETTEPLLITETGCEKLCSSPAAITVIDC